MVDATNYTLLTLYWIKRFCASLFKLFQRDICLPNWGWWSVIGSSSLAISWLHIFISFLKGNIFFLIHPSKKNFKVSFPLWNYPFTGLSSSSELIRWVCSQPFLSIQVHTNMLDIFGITVHKIQCLFIIQLSFESIHLF